MVYVFLAEGFEEIEALTPVDLIRRAGLEVKTVGVSGEIIEGSHGIRVCTDISLADAKAEIMSAAGAEMIVLPGGMPGTKNLGENADVVECIKAVRESGGFIGAICAAPSVLGELGLLDGRMATCYPGFEDKLTGAQTYDCDVIRDGEIITGRAMGSAVEFALELVGALKDDTEAEKIRDSIFA